MFDYLLHNLCDMITTKIVSLIYKSQVGMKTCQYSIDMLIIIFSMFFGLFFFGFTFLTVCWIYAYMETHATKLMIFINLNYCNKYFFFTFGLFKKINNKFSFILIQYREFKHFTTVCQSSLGNNPHFQFDYAPKTQKILLFVWNKH
jgi:hypothetical protein